MSNFHPLTVKNILRETPNSVALTFSIPSDLKETFSFIPGQYITIKHVLDGQEVRRAYSICSTPNEETITVGIKKVEEGHFSVFANSTLKEGDTLEVMPPEGKFVLNPNASNAKKYVAFAAGSGITPVLSIIKTALEVESNSTFLLVYGNKSVEETMFYDEISHLKDRYSERFSVEYIFSQKKVENALFGRITKASTNYIIKNKNQDHTFDVFYLCGPEAMIKEVKSTLGENGVDASNIHFELFTTSEEENEITVSSGKSQIKVIIDDEEYEFTMSKKKVILDGALAEKIDAPFSCQGGICSTCIARIIEGKAEMAKNQILTDAEIEEGLILTCQAHPISAKVVVDYDDV